MEKNVLNLKFQNSCKKSPTASKTKVGKLPRAEKIKKKRSTVTSFENRNLVLKKSTNRNARCGAPILRKSVFLRPRSERFSKSPLAPKRSIWVLAASRPPPPPTPLPRRPRSLDQQSRSVFQKWAGFQGPDRDAKGLEGNQQRGLENRTKPRPIAGWGFEPKRGTIWGSILPPSLSPIRNFR